MSALANEHIKTIDAISNLATATTADCTAVANLATTNAALVNESAVITAKLVMAMTKFPSVTQKLFDFQAGNKGGGSGHRYLNKHYC